MNRLNGKLPVYKTSFFMSPNRPDGLQLEMFYEDGIVLCDLFVDNRFEGYSDVIHGGMIFGILDTMVWYVIFMRSKKIAMTRKVEMEFMKPVMCSTHYRAVGKLIRIEEKNIYATAWIEDDSGEVYSQIHVTFREGKNFDVTAFIDRFDFSNTTPAIRDYFLSILDTE